MSKIKNVLIVVTVMVLVICFKDAYSQTDKEKLKIFYKYDEMYFVRFKGLKGVEKGYKWEIFDIDKISKGYRERVREYSGYITEVISKNIKLFKEFYDLAKEDGVVFNPSLLLKPRKGYEKVYDKYQELKEILKKEILNHYANCPRVMWSLGMAQFFVIGKEIEKGVYASTAEWPDFELVYWNDYYFDAEYLPEGVTTKYIGKEGQMRFREWYYESNLKIRIVKQIRDKDNNYLGELAVDFYKFDDYEKLFDKEGNPRSSHNEQR